MSKQTETIQQTDEFAGKPFHPSSFFWKNQTREMSKVKLVCGVLNTLTPEQIAAVKYLVEDRVASEAWDQGS